MFWATTNNVWMPIYTVLAYPISHHYQEPHTNRNEFITSLAETIVILMHTNVCPSQFHFVLFICFNTTGSREHQENHRYGRLSLSRSNRLKQIRFWPLPPDAVGLAHDAPSDPLYSRLRMGCPLLFSTWSAPSASWHFRPLQSLIYGSVTVHGCKTND